MTTQRTPLARLVQNLLAVLVGVALVILGVAALVALDDANEPTRVSVTGPAR